MLLHRARCAHMNEENEDKYIYGIDIENGRFFALHVMDAFSTSCQSGIRHASQQPRASQMSNVCPFPDFLVVPAGTTAVPKTIRPDFLCMAQTGLPFSQLFLVRTMGTSANPYLGFHIRRKLDCGPYHHGPAQHLLPSQPSSAAAAAAAAAKTGFGGDDRCRHAPARRRDVDEPFIRHM